MNLSRGTRVRLTRKVGPHNAGAEGTIDWLFAEIPAGFSETIEKMGKDAHMWGYVEEPFKYGLSLKGFIDLPILVSDRDLEVIG